MRFRATLRHSSSEKGTTWQDHSPPPSVAERDSHQLSVTSGGTLLEMTNWEEQGVGKGALPGERMKGTSDLDELRESRRSSCCHTSTVVHPLLDRQVRDSCLPQRWECAAWGPEGLEMERRGEEQPASQTVWDKCLSEPHQWPPLQHGLKSLALPASASEGDWVMQDGH